MNSKLDAIVLKSAPYKENDLILSLLSSNSGRVDALVRGVKKSRRSVIFTQPFSYSEFDLYRSGKQGLYIVDTAEPKENFFELREDLSALSLAQYFAEVCMYLPKESLSGDEFMFLRLLLNSLYVLCKKKDISPLTVKMVFELKFAKYQGFEPDFSECSVCGRDEGDIWVFDQGIYCKNCEKDRPGYKINDTVRKIATHILKTDNLGAYAVFADDKILSYIGSLTEKYLEFVTERSYKSLDCFRQIRDIEALVSKGKDKNNE